MFAKTPELPAAAGWAAEGGGRYFGSLGRYGEDFGFLPSTPAPAISSISRLTFQDMQTNSGEFFGRIDTPWDLFVKGYVGGGTSGHSHLNDEDFLVGLGGGPFPYSNTLSPIVDGRIGYRAIDAGYDFLRGSKSERSPATFSSFAALLVTAFYLALSGAVVATTTPVHHDCDRAHRRHA